MNLIRHIRRFAAAVAGLAAAVLLAAAQAVFADRALAVRRRTAITAV
jgi:hypothetical protein